MRTTKSVYFTLGDLVALENAGWYPNTASDIQFATIMTTYGLVIEDSTSDKLSILYQLIRMIYAEYFHEYAVKKIIGLYEDETNVVLSTSEKKEVWREFVNLFNMTAPRYIPLLKSYKSNEATPLAKITSSTSGINRFNDTPQDSGDFATDSHTSTINENNVTVEADSGSVAQRLDELFKNWRSILKDWTFEFRCLFYTKI